MIISQKQKIEKIEKKVLIITLLPIFLMGVSGIFFGIIANSSAVILDGLFSLILFVTTVIALLISIFNDQLHADTYPHSHWLVESLYTIFKIFILLLILIYSLTTGLSSIIKYYFFTFDVQTVNLNILYYYYLFKGSLGIILFGIYSFYIIKVEDKSSLLRVERKSGLVDFGGTIAIAFGFLILGNFKLTKDIADQIILILLSVYLIFDLIGDFRIELKKAIGRQNLTTLESKYIKLLNKYFIDLTIHNIQIHYGGKVTIVSINASFEGLKKIEDIIHYEKEIKKVMQEDLETVYLYTYWDQHNSSAICI